MDKSRTLSQTTATGNVRTVRLNTYRERKRECQELQKETEQLSNTVYELQGENTTSCNNIFILFSYPGQRIILFCFKRL